jgi:disulfide bond formation protein DsbB
MMMTMMMNNHNARDARLRRERSLLVLLGLVCLALLAGALFMQFVKNEMPCPLCIIQRYCLILIAIFAFVGASFTGWRAVRAAEILAVLAALGGLVASARLVYVQAFPAATCGFDKLEPIVDGLPPAHWLPGVFQTAGLCTTVYPPILGLSLPVWGLVGFACMVVAVVASLWRNRRRGASRFGV